MWGRRRQYAGRSRCCWYCCRYWQESSASIQGRHESNEEGQDTLMVQLLSDVALKAARLNMKAESGISNSRGYRTFSV